MKKQKSFFKLQILLTVLLLSFQINGGFSQGCNDAGFCSMGELKQGGVADSSNFQILTSSVFRLGERNSAYLSMQVTTGIKLWQSSRFSVSFPFQTIAGNLGIVAGVGDMAVDLTQNLYKKQDNKISFTIGAIIKTNDANLKKNNEALPMAYQTSQGTNDIVAGINLIHKKWHYSFGYQHNLNANKNGYIDSLSNFNSDVTYFDSRKIDRGDDILLRIEKEIAGKGNTKYFVGVLPIYRLQKATIENSAGQRIDVDGSSGLTININAGYSKPITEKSNVNLFVGVPVVTRHVRPDGLTGTFVINLSINWQL